MRALVRPVAWVALALAAGVGACRCGAPASPPADAAPPDGFADAQPERDVGPDARRDGAQDARPDAFVDAEPCDATFIELPPTGLTFISVVSNQGRWVAYDYRQMEGTGPDIYLYDLKTCTEHRITNDPNLMQDQPFVWNGAVVYADQLEPNHATISRYDIATGTFASYPSVTALGVSILGAVDGYIAYADKYVAGYHNPMYFRLLETATGRSTLLQSTADGASSGGDISETHFAWPSMVLNEYNGIWYADLSTGDSTKVEGSTEGIYPTTWGDWLVWEDWRSGGPDLWGERMGAGEQVHVTDNGAYNGFPRLRGHLLCFRTTLWAGGLGWDIALLDMDTWVMRRVTTTTHPGYECGHADGGWLVYRKQVAQDFWHYDKIYAVNLVKNGFLDATGHLIPE